MKEEIDLNIEKGELKVVIENFFCFSNDQYHELDFMYDCGTINQSAAGHMLLDTETDAEFYFQVV